MNTTNIYRIAFLIDEFKRTTFIEWSYFNRHILSQHEIVGNQIAADILTGTLNTPIEHLAEESADENKALLNLIAAKTIDLLIVFGNPFKTELHGAGMNETFVHAIDQNILTAFNTDTAGLLIRAINANLTETAREGRMKIA
jgi:methylglyoxal synthase